MEGPQYKERSGTESTESSPGRFVAHTEKDVEYEEIQPFLVAAWRHSGIGGDRLQELRQLRLELRRTGWRFALWRQHGNERANRRRRSNDVFAGFDAKLPVLGNLPERVEHVE
jgi:hypothetical protein